MSWRDNEPDTVMVGRKVVGIDVAANDEAIRFRFEEGEPHVWAVEGDCCSHSYWHEAFALNQLRGGTVANVIVVDDELPEADDADSYECLQVYGYRIVTDIGAATLVFRNSSNGYYGGWKYNTNDSDSFKWREIAAGDWEAGTDSDPPVYTPEELAQIAEEKRLSEERSTIAAGLESCASQLSTVGQMGGLAYMSYGDRMKLAEIAQGLRDVPVGQIVVLGTYLLGCAEEAMAKHMAEQAEKAREDEAWDVPPIALGAAG